ncbi:MAG: extracellular solute-binding protein [Clostridia bacterium]|nr:extracellular solute-binding protein [Clostridia bacterium]
MLSKWRFSETNKKETDVKSVSYTDSGFLMRVWAIILIFCMLAMSSCSDKPDSEAAETNQTVQIGDTIENDTPWYDTQRIVLPESLVNSDIVVLDDSVVITSLEGLDSADANMYWQAVCYGFDGNLRWKIKAGENRSTSGSSADSASSAANDVSLLQVEDKLYILGTVSNIDMYSEINPVDGSVISDGCAQDVPEIGGRPQEVMDLGFIWLKNTLRCGNNTVSYCCSTEGPCLWSCSDGEYKTLNCGEALSAYKIDEIRNVIPIGDDRVLLVMLDMSSDVLTYSLDLNNMNLEPFKFDGALSENNPLELVQGATQNANQNGEGCEIYSKHLDELYLIDLESMTESEVYSGSLCNCNLVDIYNSTLVEATEERYVFFAQTVGARKQTGAIYICSKAESNPNAGKKVLEAASVDGLTYEIAEAIYKYNRDNSSGFILYSDEYESGVIRDEHEINREDDLFYIAGADLSDKLMVDIMAGEGPDIILNSSEYRQLNNENCLMDLSQYADDLSSDLYFTNIIEASENNGKLYQLPVSFKVSGLVAYKNTVGRSEGFTYDTYVDAIDGLCNGMDPLSINNGRIQYMDELINSEFSHLIKEDGTVDAESENFKRLIEYCAGVDEISYFNRDSELGIISENTSDGYNLPMNYRSIDNVDEYVNILEANNALYGLPSDTVRGPSASVVAAIGISGSCENPDAAWEFAVALLDAEVQSNTEALPLSKEAFVEMINGSVAEHNDMVERLGDLGGFSKLDADYSLKSQEFLSGINSVTGCDTSMLIIINEEVQAYFAGQKTVDEVCDLIQNRCNLVSNER